MKSGHRVSIPNFIESHFSFYLQLRGSFIYDFICGFSALENAHNSTV